GIVPARHSPVGVFAGVMSSDYAELTSFAGKGAVGRHALTGLSRGIVANRVSHFFGFRGPSLTVDTGQSSSLVAVHLACMNLQDGACTMALAGGVNLIASPLSSLRAARFGALSPDGRCYAFDSRANGFVRGEGGGFVALKTLSRALADGDQIKAVVRGSAVNSGSSDEGLTVPDQAAQEAVIREALRA